MTGKIERKRALVVDDSRAMRWAIRRILEDLSFEVTEAENGAVALEALEPSTGFDVILLDLDMPVMDGMEFLDRFGQLPVAPRVPVVMCSTQDAPATIHRALDAGAKEYIMKPFTPDIVRWKLTSLGVIE